MERLGRFAKVKYFYLKEVKRRLLPIAILFTEYYFYLLAYKDGAKSAVPYYFRIDRITKITRRRTTFTLTREQDFAEEMKTEIEKMRKLYK